MEHFANLNLSVVVGKIMFSRVCGVIQYFYGFSLYHNIDLDDRIFDCLLTYLIVY